MFKYLLLMIQYIIYFIDEFAIHIIYYKHLVVLLELTKTLIIVYSK